MAAKSQNGSCHIAHQLLTYIPLWLWSATRSAGSIFDLPLVLKPHPYQSSLLLQKMGLRFQTFRQILCGKVLSPLASSLLVELERMYDMPGLLALTSAVSVFMGALLSPYFLRRGSAWLLVILEISSLLRAVWS